MYYLRYECIEKEIGQYCVSTLLDRLYLIWETLILQVSVHTISTASYEIID